MRLIGHGVGLVDFDLRSLEGLLEISDMRFGRASEFLLRSNRSAVQLGGKIETTLAARIVDADQGGGRARLLESFSHHNGDRLMVVIDIRRRQHALDVELADTKLTGVVMCDESQYARSGLGPSGIDRRDPSLRDRRAENVAIGDVRRDIMMLVSVRRPPGGLELRLEAVDGLSDHLQLVDRVTSCRRVELHGSALCF